MTSGEEDMEDWDDDVGGEDAMEITLHALTSVEHTTVLESFQSMRQHASKASNVAIEDNVVQLYRQTTVWEQHHYQFMADEWRALVDLEASRAAEEAARQQAIFVVV
jgi:hypothetical protein